MQFTQIRNGQYTTPRRSCWKALVALGVVTCLLAGSQRPSTADPTVMSVSKLAPQGATTDQACGWLDTTQGHGGIYLSRKVQTTYLTQRGSDCGTKATSATVVDPGWIIQKGSVYKTPSRGQPGTVCVHGGWQPNWGRASSVFWSTTEDMWPWCNNGNGVAVTITHDVTSGVWLSRVGAYAHGGPPWPNTWHDYPSNLSAKTGATA